jgi:hypothetical protein
MNKKIFFIVAISIIVVSKKVLAASEIVDVRRNITLSDDEAPTKDFYIKISDGGGLKKNLVVKATRKISVKDSSQKPVGDFSTVVGLIKIIHVEGAVAVAREFKLLPRNDQPMLEQIGIMTGDQIDLSESYIDTSKPVELKKKVASLDEKTELEVPTLETKDLREPATATSEKSTQPAIKIDSIQRDI